MYSNADSLSFNRVLEQYGLEADSYDALSNSVIAVTVNQGSGKCLLHRFSGRIDQFKIFYDFHKEISGLAFPYIFKILSNTDYSKINESYYYLTYFDNGIQASQSGEMDAKSLGELLSYFHAAGKSVPQRINKYTPLDLAAPMSKVIEELTHFKSVSRTIRNTRYAHAIDACLLKAQTILEGLNRSGYSGFINNKNNIAINVMNTSPSNFFIKSTGELVLLSLSNLMPYPAFYEIARVIDSYAKNGIESSRLLLDSYETNNPLSEQEKEFIRYYLAFPWNFWRAGNNYFIKGKFNAANLEAAVYDISARDEYIENILYRTHPRGGINTAETDINPPAPAGLDVASTTQNIPEDKKYQKQDSNRSAFEKNVDEKTRNIYPNIITWNFPDKK